MKLPACLHPALRRNLAVVLLAVVLSPFSRAASMDEIQVYDDAINKQGEFGLDWHMNHVITGLTLPAWPGDAPSNRSSRITPEFSYGLSQSWELGAYLPLLHLQGGATYMEGAKLRIKYLPPHEEAAFYWGMNLEAGRVSHRSSDQYWNFELRPILGFRYGDWHFSANPILGLDSNHLVMASPEFTPALRLVYEFSENFNLGVEHYASFGKLDSPSPYGQQSQNSYLAVNAEIAGYAVNFGIGKGWNSSSDKWTAKAIIGARY